MDSVTFAVMLAENYEIFLLFMGVSVVAHIFLVRWFTLGIMDPATMAILGNAFAFATAMFVFYLDESSRQYFYSYLSTEVAFWAGVFAFSPTAKSMAARIHVMRPIIIPREARLIFWALFCIFVALKLLQFKLVGIPLFAYTRIGMAVDSGGLGAFQTLSSMISPILMFCLFMLMIYGKIRSVGAYFVLCVISIILLLDGSKSALVPIFQLAFLTACFVGGGKLFALAKKYEKKYFIHFVVLILALAITAVYLKEQDLNRALFLISFRFVGFGDAYFMAFPNAIIERLNGGGFIETIFYPMLSTVRIVNASDVPPSLGVLLTQEVEKLFEGGGPNSRHNLIGIYYFGGGGFIFSFVIGMTIGLLRRIIFLNISGWYGRFFMVFVFYTSAALFTDTPFAINALVLGALIFVCWAIAGKLLCFGVPSSQLKRVS